MMLIAAIIVGLFVAAGGVFVVTAGVLLVRVLAAWVTEVFER